MTESIATYVTVYILKHAFFCRLQVPHNLDGVCTITTPQKYDVSNRNSEKFSWENRPYACTERDFCKCFQNSLTQLEINKEATLLGPLLRGHFWRVGRQGINAFIKACKYVKRPCKLHRQSMKWSLLSLYLHQIQKFK